MIITSNGPKTISQIRRYVEHGDLFLSPVEYQRENAWDLDQKKLLIDTVFRNLDIPKFYLWKIDQTTLANGYSDSPPRNTTRGSWSTNEGKTTRRTPASTKSSMASSVYARSLSI